MLRFLDVFLIVFLDIFLNVVLYIFDLMETSGKIFRKIENSERTVMNGSVHYATRAESWWL